jgi:hypothetical protein
MKVDSSFNPFPLCLSLCCASLSFFFLNPTSLTKHNAWHATIAQGIPKKNQAARGKNKGKVKRNRNQSIPVPFHHSPTSYINNAVARSSPLSRLRQAVRFIDVHTKEQIGVGKNDDREEEVYERGGSRNDSQKPFKYTHKTRKIPSSESFFTRPHCRPSTPHQN